MIITDVAAPKSLVNRFVKVSGNSAFQESVGLNGDTTIIIFRFISIDQENYESYYRITIAFGYPTKLDDVEHDKIKVDDNDPASVVGHIKQMIRKLRPECELTDIMLEFWDLVPKTAPDPKNYPFKTYIPIQRRQMQDIDPLSTKAWTSNRVTLVGDAAHAMSPILGLGANNAILDAESLSKALLNYSPENYISCIKEYESEMLQRNSADVLKGRSIALRQSRPVGYFGVIFRNGFIKILNAFMNYFDYNFLVKN